MFFVLSSGRSGSRTIAFALNSYRNCECHHHRDPELVLEATQYYYGEYSAEKIAEALRSTRKENLRKGVYGEVNLQFSLIVPIIEQVFPGSKYIWLLRDGRDVVASMYFRRWYDPEDKKVPMEWKKARLQGDKTGDFSPTEWNIMSRFAKCCWLWKKYNLIIESHMQKLNQERWMKVRIDKLKTSLPELAQFLSLHDSSKVLVEKHNVAYQPVTYWDGWDDVMKDSFELYCGDVMDKWFPEWRSENGKWRKIDAETPDEAGILLRCKRWLAGLPPKTSLKIRGLKRRISEFYARNINRGKARIF